MHPLLRSAPFFLEGWKMKLKLIALVGAALVFAGPAFAAAPDLSILEAELNGDQLVTVMLATGAIFVAVWLTLAAVEWVQEMIYQSTL